MNEGAIIAAVAGPAGMALVAWYLITRTLPGMTKIFQEELRALRSDNSALRDELDKVRETHTSNSNRKIEAIGKLNNRLSRVEATIVAQSGGRSSLDTEVGIQPEWLHKKPRD